MSRSCVCFCVQDVCIGGHVCIYRGLGTRECVGMGMHTHR